MIQIYHSPSRSRYPLLLIHDLPVLLKVFLLGLPVSHHPVPLLDPSKSILQPHGHPMLVARSLRSLAPPTPEHSRA